MDETEIRKLFISNEEWNRTSSAWKLLKPLRNFNELRADDETSEECFKRLQDAGFCIPLSVIEQWIYPHYYNVQTVNNYGWIDYSKAVFVEKALPLTELTELYVIKEYRNYVEHRSKAKPFEDFMCSPKDLDYWKTHSTWRTPPVVVDVTSLFSIPLHADIGGALQLIEGHTRLGYLLALKNAGQLRLYEHIVFLLRIEQ